MTRTRRRRWIVALAVVAAVAGLVCYLDLGLWWDWLRNGHAQTQPSTRPAKWAQKVDEPAVGNFHKVSAGLYRGAQPDEKGFAALQRMGIKTVVNLRNLHSDRDEMGDLPLEYHHIWFDTAKPEMNEIVRFLRIVTDPANQPVFVHCQHGSDRTGTMVAAYRIYVDGWTPNEALAEMTGGGFGFHGGFVHLPEFIRRLDRAELKRLIERPSTGPASRTAD